MTDEERFEKWWRSNYSWPLELGRQDLLDAWLTCASLQTVKDARISQLEQAIDHHQDIMGETANLADEALYRVRGRR